MKDHHPTKCVQSVAWDIEEAPCTCPAGWPRRREDDRTTWRCPECGESPTLDSRWRWCDGRPQHHHGYPVGHIPAERAPFVARPEVRCGEPGWLEPARGGAAMCEAERDGWLCTRSKRHGGPHASHVRVQVAKWEDGTED